MKKKKKFGLKGIIIILALLVIVFMSLISFFTDYLWFKELGYVSVFFKQLFTQLKIGIPTFVIITFLAYVYLKMIKKGYYKKIESEEVPNEKTLNLISWGLGAVFGAVVTYISVTKLWFEILKFSNSTDVGIKDPLFNMDISFYMFKLQFIEQLNQIVIGVLVAFIILTLVYYLILMSVRTPKMFDKKEEPEDIFEEEDRFDGNFQGSGGGKGFGGQSFGGLGDIFDKIGKVFSGGRNINRPQKRRKQFDDNNFMQLISIASKQLIVVGVMFFIMVGVNFFLRQYKLLHAHTGAVYGAGYTDVNITLWVYRIMIALALIAAITFAIGIIKKRFKLMLTVPVIMIVVGLVGMGASMLVQRLVVEPDAIDKESQYLSRNIEYTQYAYDLQNVDIKPFAATSDLSTEDIENNMETISNIRINDYEPAEKFYNQTQSIRPYYSFNDVDVDRYMINGEYTQTFLSAREIDETKISEAWLNRHLKYTHSYGITLSRVDEVTESGQPDMLIDSIPPVSEVKEIDITRPEIYFGESTNNYALVGTDEDEFDYPDGDSNKYARYEGNAGVNLGLLNRFMFAVRERSLKLLVSSNISSESKIIFRRNIKERVETIMPYLSYDEDPYMITVDGNLYWIIDAYTVSDRYPYSEPYDSTTSNINYIRNSVKVVIDAYNGDTNYYIVDEDDAIAQTYRGIYPKLFKTLDEMPDEIQAHIRYPNTMFDIQANVYRRYHMNDVKVFFQNEDMWEIANETYGTKETQMVPNYYIMKLPGEKTAEFVNSIPYTPKNKKNMTGLLVARNDGDEYGNLVLYQMPKSKIVYGPMQIEGFIDQNTEISKEFSLWNSAGSSYNRGNIFVIPIEDSLLYVEPVYLEAKNSSIPEVKRVIVAYGDQISYKETLGEALEALFDAGQKEDAAEDEDRKDDGNLSQSELIEKASEAYDNATEAQENGDWTGYGKYLDELESYLNQLSND